MKQGLYEQLINNVTLQQLTSLDTSAFDIGKEALDPEEARKLLSNYIATVTRRALKAVRDNSDTDEEAVLSQVRACNEIISTLKNTLDQEDYEELQLVEHGEVLTYVYAKLNSIRAVKEEKVLRPTTPLSQSSLFTGSHAEPNMLSLRLEVGNCGSYDYLYGGDGS